MNRKRLQGLYKNRPGFKHVILSFLFAYAYVSIPWEYLYGNTFKDKQNYLDYLWYGQSVLTYLSFDGVVDYVKGEWLWHYLLDNFVRSGWVEPETFFNWISFLLVFSFSLVVCANSGPWYLLMLFNPIVVVFGFSQLRNALAIVLLIFASLSESKIIRISILIVSSLIHTSSLVFVSLYYGADLLFKRFVRFNDVTWLRNRIVIAGLGISVLLGPALGLLLGAIGDRRVGEKDVSSTLLYLSFWIISAILYLWNIKKITFNSFTVFSLIMLLAAALTVITKGYSLRILAVLYPFFIVMLSRAHNTIRKPILAAFVVYIAFQWLYWFKLI